jgi:hypothetical protein
VEGEYPPIQFRSSFFHGTNTITTLAKSLKNSMVILFLLYALIYELHAVQHLSSQP